jgi:hypothetical protein
VDSGGTRGLRKLEEVFYHPTYFGSAGTNLQVHISATSNVVSTAIIIEREESNTTCKIRYLVYFVSEVLSNSKSRYFQIMKLAYALLITTHKLYHYFQAHRIEVHTS